MDRDFEHFFIDYEIASNQVKGPVILILCAVYTINISTHCNFSFPSIVLHFKITFLINFSTL